jgi:hypothetical protein
VNSTSRSLVAIPTTLFRLPQYWWGVTQLRSMQIVTNPFRLRARKLANQNRVHKPNTTDVANKLRIFFVSVIKGSYRKLVYSRSVLSLQISSRIMPRLFQNGTVQKISTQRRTCSYSSSNDMQCRRQGGKSVLITGSRRCRRRP